jgi:pimeloyl-ACP methyl ester carboxylesterase
LYVPSSYDAGYRWPLVVLCHGTRPWDTAQRQILDWVKLAEEEQFIVVAPELRGTSALSPPPPEKQIPLQIEDERHILDVVRQIKGAYQISEDRVFLSGWSAGNFAVLYTGLKHPQLFRALAVQQGNFDSGYLVDVQDRIDPHQPVAVIYGAADLFAGPDPKDCLAWLRGRGANVFEMEVGGGHRSHPKETQSFFRRVLGRVPWLHIRVLSVEGRDAMTAQFKTRGSFAPAAYRWGFGDGAETFVADPIHRFAEPGTYRVTLEATMGGDGGRVVKRAVEVTMPQLQALEPRRTEWEE